MIKQLYSSIEDEILALKAEKDAVILAHNYQTMGMQKVADYVGDSLYLARVGSRLESKTIVFAGVYFMAETMCILSPEKRVLIPDPDAGCSLAATIQADEIRAWKADHSDGIVVTYVNSSAEVKAESDYCCTSSAEFYLYTELMPPLHGNVLCTRAVDYCVQS